MAQCIMNTCQPKDESLSIAMTGWIRAGKDLHGSLGRYSSTLNITVWFPQSSAPALLCVRRHRYLRQGTRHIAVNPE